MKKIWNAAFEIADFAAHFYKMSDEEILRDIKEGIDLSISRKIPESGSCFLAKCMLEAENKMKKISDINRENVNARWKEKDPKPDPKPKRPPNVSPDGEVIEPFVPPTIEQVQALCVEKRYPDPQGLAFRFFNFYSPDWKTGKGKRTKIMNSWPMALAGWVSRDNGVFRVPEFADIQKYLTENCAKAGLDVDFVATQFLNKGTKEGWKGIRNWEAMLKQYVNTIVCSQSKGSK
jgi:hypothetical protein